MDEYANDIDYEDDFIHEEGEEEEEEESLMDKDELISMVGIFLASCWSMVGVPPCQTNLIQLMKDSGFEEYPKLRHVDEEEDSNNAKGFIFLQRRQGFKIATALLDTTLVEVAVVVETASKTPVKNMISAKVS